MIREDVQEFVVRFVRVAVQHPEPVDPVDLRRFFHQGGQGCVLMGLGAVAGGVLGDEDMLPDAPGRQVPDLRKDLFLPAAAVGAADQGNRAEGAAVGAAFADPDIGGIRRRGEHAAVFAVAEVVRAGADGRGGLPFQRFADHGGQLPVLVDAEEDIDLREFLQEVLFIPLDQAAGDHQQAALSGLLELRHFEDRVDGFFLGGVDEAAGIDHEDVGFFGPGGEDKAVLLQQAEGGLGIHPVLVAAEGNDAYGICHRYSPFPPDGFPAKE